MLKKILSYGVVAGLMVGVPLSCITVSMSGHMMLRYGMVIGYLIMLIALSTVFVAIKRHRDADLGGIIKFWPAFGLGLGISFIAGVIYVLAWEAAVAITHVDFASNYARAMIAQQQAQGVSGEALAKLTAQIGAIQNSIREPTVPPADDLCGNLDDVTFLSHISRRWPRSGSMELPRTNEPDHK